MYNVILLDQYFSLVFITASRQRLGWAQIWPCRVRMFNSYRKPGREERLLKEEFGTHIGVPPRHI